LSVAIAAVPRIIPIFRDIEHGFKPASPELMGRFNGRTVLNGDLSGGQYIILFNLTNVGDYFGSHCLWKVKSISVKTSAAIVGFYCIIDINHGEVVNDNFQGLTTMVMPVFSTGIYFDHANFPDIYYATERVQATIQITCGANTNATYVDAQVQGEFYDERLI
jgi:hypothetical protein